MLLRQHEAPISFHIRIDKATQIAKRASAVVANGVDHEEGPGYKYYKKGKARKVASDAKAILAPKVSRFELASQTSSPGLNLLVVPDWFPAGNDFLGNRVRGKPIWGKSMLTNVDFGTTGFDKHRSC